MLSKSVRHTMLHGGKEQFSPFFANKTILQIKVMDSVIISTKCVVQADSLCKARTN
jgi:hypothetical protein